MPVGAAVGIAGVAGAGASMYASSKASKAASKATDQNAQIQQQQYAQTRADLAPATATLAPATAALMQRLGLSSGGASTGQGGQSGPAAGAAQAAPAINDQQAKQILADRPDVANSQWLNSIDPSVIGDRTGDGQVDQSDRAAYWAANYGAQDGYKIPAAAATLPAQAPTTPGQTLDTSARPDFTEPAPTIGTGPSSATYTDPSQFMTSPGYQFALDQGLRNLNASYGAKGLLKSGSAMQGITDYAQGQASQQYNNWFSQQMQKLGADQGQFNNDRSTQLAQYNQDRNIFNTNFNTDRGYNTDLYNTQTSNLFNLAGIGQAGAAGTAAAGQNYASGATANNNNNASVQGNAAIAGANGVNSAINTGVQAYGMYSNPFSVSSGGTMANASTATQNAFNGIY